ncbi:MAG: class I SAM-dependent methyltransferase [Candidatus Limnocylindrales bacterium]
MKRRLLTWLHDSSFWSDYRPKMPAGAVAGGLAGAAATWVGVRLGQRRHDAAAAVSLLLGLGLLAPAVALGLVSWFMRRQRMAIRAQILGAVDWPATAWVLDVGCGTGMLLNGAAQRVPEGRVVGIDVWDAHAGGGTLDVLMANARAEGVADRIEFQYADARALPFGDGLFDIVLCAGAVHHIVRDHADLQRLMDELSRVLKPSGRLVLWDVPHALEASAALLRERGLSAEIGDAVPFLGFQNSILVATKAGAPA